MGFVGFILHILRFDWFVGCLDCGFDAGWWRGID